MISTAHDLLSLGSGELDEVFRAGHTAPMPDGPGTGTVIAAPGTALARPLALAGSLLWRGKVFDATATTLQNLLSPAGVHAIKAVVVDGVSRLDDAPCLVLDYSRTSLLARPVRDEIREVAPGLWLGLVFVGSRRAPVHFALSF